MDQPVLIRREGPVEQVVLNRPDVRNAFNPALIETLRVWAVSTAVSTDARVAVLSGIGKVFCAGGDLGAMSATIDASHDENLEDAARMAAMFEALDQLPIPLVGRVHGAALGGGLGLAAVCDIVVAADDALFGFTEVKLGIVPSVISPYALAKIGRSAARELFLTGARFDAARAREIGLVHAVVPAERLDDTVNGYVGEILSAGPEAVRKAKALIRRVAGRPAGRSVGLHGRDARRPPRLPRRAGRHARVPREADPLVGGAMIRRLLVANRGEIAVRVIRACRELDIETVAVCSDADRRALHATLADVAVPIGPAPALDSYLRVERLIEAARTSGADAVHPGYGFLSENAGFAQACEDAGLIFVGPPASVISQMGSKIEARARAIEAGLPIVPGGTPAAQDDAALREAADRVGFPLLVKASAGGGGKGMRVVHACEDLAEAFAAARHEAAGAFGDATLYFERLLRKPSHVEVQIVGDAHGHLVHLFERDCSTQRRHQKVIEESPAPWLSDALRRRMGEAAVTLARHIGYRNAGTIEFLVEGRGDDAQFYFLEMNTRLQVEHPVTEAVAGRRPGPRAAARGVGRAAPVEPGLAGTARARDRVPSLRRGSVGRFPPAGRAACGVPRAAGPRHPRGQRRGRGRRGQHLLRPAAREAGRVG